VRVGLRVFGLGLGRLRPLLPGLCLRRGELRLEGRLDALGLPVVRVRVRAGVRVLAGP